MWRNATVRECATIPGFPWLPAAHREQDKFDQTDNEHPADNQEWCILHGGAHTVVSNAIEDIDDGRTANGRQGQDC